MAIQKYTNNAVDTLNGAITNVQTTITLNDASEFPSIGAGEQYYATITDGTNIEIVLVTDDASTPTLTVTRGQQGTSGTAFADGTTVSHRYTAADGDNWVQRADTGSIDLSGATEFKIPTDAAPTVNADGEIALDTTVTDFSHGVVKYYGGEEMGVIAMPIAQFTTPTDAYVVSYNATNDEFELVAQTGGGISAVVDDTTPQLGGDLDVNGNQITGAIDLDSSGNIELRLGDNAGVNRVRFRDSDDVVQATLDSDGEFIVNGAVNFGSSTSLEVPNGAAPTVDADGEIAVDTSVTGINGGLLKYYRGEEMGCVAMPSGNFSGMADGSIIAYNSTDSDFEAVSELPVTNGGTGVDGLSVVFAAVTSTQTVPTASFNKIEFDNELVDTEGDYDPTTNYRFTASKAGTYLVVASMVYETASDQMVMITGVFKNGVAYSYNAAGASGTGQNGVTIAANVAMNGTTDYIEIFAYQASGSDKDLNSNSNLSVSWVGP